jgi:hypothetical protein
MSRLVNAIDISRCLCALRAHRRYPLVDLFRVFTLVALELDALDVATLSDLLKSRLIDVVLTDVELCQRPVVEGYLDIAVSYHEGI